MHMFKGYRVPPETFQAAWQAILDTHRRVDVVALRALIVGSLVAVDPWPGETRADAAVAAVDSFLYEAVRAGLVKRYMNGWKLPAWWRVREKQGAACR